MNWNFGQTDLKEEVRAQDQTFTPDEVAIFFVMYDHDRDRRKFLTEGQKILIERWIAEGMVPSRRQYELAKRMSGIMQNIDHAIEH